MNKENHSTILIIKDNIHLHKYSNDDFEKNIDSIFNNFNKMNKGITFIEKDKLLNINNKYYSCDLKLVLHESNDQNIINECEGLIIYWHANDLKTERINKIIKSFNNKPHCSIILFEEDRLFLSQLSDFEKFVEFSIENNLEIITNIKDGDNCEDDDGVVALSMSLQSCHWSYSEMKKGKVVESAENVNKEVNDIEEDVIENEHNGYTQLKDEKEFDNFLEKINDVRNLNMNQNLSNEERRKNAENAIMMLSKFINIDDLDEDDLDDDSN